MLELGLQLLHSPKGEYLTFLIRLQHHREMQPRWDIQERISGTIATFLSYKLVPKRKKHLHYKYEKKKTYFSGIYKKVKHQAR